MALASWCPLWDSETFPPPYLVCWQRIHFFAKSCFQVKRSKGRVLADRWAWTDCSLPSPSSRLWNIEPGWSRETPTTEAGAGKTRLRTPIQPRTLTRCNRFSIGFTFLDALASPEVRVVSLSDPRFNFEGIRKSVSQQHSTSDITRISIKRMLTSVNKEGIITRAMSLKV